MTSTRSRMLVGLVTGASLGFSAVAASAGQTASDAGNSVADGDDSEKSATAGQAPDRKKYRVDPRGSLFQNGSDVGNSISRDNKIVRRLRSDKSLPNQKEKQ